MASLSFPRLLDRDGKAGDDDGMAALTLKSTLYVIAVGRGHMVTDYVFGRKADQVERIAAQRSLERRQEARGPLIRYGRMVRMRCQDIPPDVLPMPDAMDCLQEGSAVVASMVGPMSPWEQSCAHVDWR